MRYNNYHKHDHKGNPWSMDVVTKEEDYCKRAVELGHTTVFTTNHGVQGDIFTWLDCSKRYGLKMIYGTEAYYVRNRKEKDKSNKHLIIIARNNSGVMQLNDIMSEAHTSGFYYRPRIDDELLFSLNPNDFIVTSACVAGIWGDRNLLLELKEHFGRNFFLEVQPHNMEIQKRLNSEMLDFSKASGIHMIHANDSHYILPEDAKYRDIFLKGKDRNYPEEDGMILDYPDSDTVLKRYKKQGIFSNSQAESLLYETLVFDDCSEITIINDDIKLPSVSNDPTGDLKRIINEQWLKERENIPKERWEEYLSAIKSEFDIIHKTGMENYFLIDYNVVKNGQEKYGGKLTNTGRGSAPSFYTTKMLGLTDIDRIDAPITLFPTRFMSVERILGARSLPDIDLNTADRTPFIKATEDLLGAENCAWMIAWKPLQASSAFRVYCKGIGKNISEYDEIAKDLDSYRDDPKWKKIIEESKRFIGVVESISESPCSMLLYDKPVRKELGLVHTKEKACCLLDGYNCDKYKYLKNDYLSVIVWAIIKETCELAGIQIPTIRELDDLIDEKTFEIYDKGLTCTINQADSDFATGLVEEYKPRSVSEMSAFVAIIRPGCASLLQDFIHRKPYTTGVEELDNILIEGNHRMIYQELIMKYLIWLGIPETGSYDIIKKIAKKKFKEKELADLKEQLLKGWIKRVGSEDGFIETWTVVEQAAKYSFNACVSGDTVIQKCGANGHWKPTVEEMYMIRNNLEYAKKTNHMPLRKKYLRCGYGYALSMYDDYRIKKNRIVDIRQSGVRPVYRVSTESGVYIDCTMNHKFPTPKGVKHLEELCVGDSLYVKDEYEVNRDKYNFTDGNFVSNLPVAGEKGFQKIPNGNSVMFHSEHERHVTKMDGCSICGKTYSQDLRFELHHKDFDRTNNNPDNLMWLCCSCHKKIHYNNGRRKIYDKGIPTRIEKIVSITYLRDDMTYDIEMADPAHTIVSKSGLVASNSHSLSYAYDSLYGAYLKSHYPLEYYTTVLNYYSGDEKRTRKLTDELKYFGIKLRPIKFRFSGAKYSFNRESNEIYKGIISIKYMNELISDLAVELKDKEYASFIDCIDDFLSTAGVNIRQMRILIDLDFFEEFGDANYLNMQLDLFDKYSGRSQISKKELNTLHVSEEEARSFSAKETAKMFSGIDSLAMLRIAATKLKYRRRTLREKIGAQIEHLGYVDIVGDQYSGIACVTSIDTKYSPRLTLYSLKNGTSYQCKIDKRTFSQTKLAKGDILKVMSNRFKPKVKKDENGNWVEIPDTRELWITKYQRLDNL